jgi:serine/threonine protein kinase
VGAAYYSVRVLGLGGDDPQRLGPYRLKAVIGDGGMGRVYLAISPAGRAVAVKVIRRGLAAQPGYRERFAREARAAMSVSGLYTASVVDADTTGESPYLATEFVPAPSLAEAVGEAGPLPAEAVLALAGGMAEALVAIHRAGLVHRDVKPHNILLAADGPVVIDFGIAAGDETGLTATGVAVGTPGYMAPEVLHGADPSASSDVFALGCVLVYAARGVGPFGKGEALAIAHRAANGEPDLGGVPEAVRALVTPMLLRDPARRPTPAQLLQHVSLSSTAVLHDGLWLPAGVRAMLERRRRDVQQALNGGTPASPPAPATAVPGQGRYPAVQPAALALPPPAYGERPPGTPAQDFSALRGAPGRPPAKSSQKRFFAAVGAGGTVVLVGAVVAAVMLTKNSDGAPPSTRQSQSQTRSQTATAQNAAGTGSPTTAASPTGAASYKPGTYDLNQMVATDLLGDTIMLDSITVNSDGSISAALIYTDEYPGEWTCAAAKPGEATLSIATGPDEPSTASDCTKDPTKTWYMTAGQTVVGHEYFAAPPVGDGSWTFGFDSVTIEGITEFSGSVSNIQIPTS